MTADEKKFPDRPELLPVDKKFPATADEEVCPINQNLASPTDVTGVVNDTSTSDDDQTESRRPVLRITNPDVNPGGQNQVQDPVAHKQYPAEIRKSTERPQEAGTGKALSIHGISTPLKESLREGKDFLVSSTIDVNSTAGELPCCQWCPDPTRSKLPAEGELQVYSLSHWTVTTQEVMEDEDEAEEKAEENDRREQAIIEGQVYLHRQALNERSGGGPSNFQDDGTAEEVPHWGLQYPDPPASQPTAPPRSQEIGQEHSEVVNHFQALSQLPGTNLAQPEVAIQPTAPPQNQEIGSGQSEVAAQSPAPSQFPQINSTRPEAAAQPPTPPQTQEANSERPGVETQAPVLARKVITFGNTPSPRRSREVDREGSDKASEDPPAYSVELSGCKEISKRLISEGEREETDYRARRPAVKDLKPGNERATANGRPIVGLGAGQIIKSKPRRGSIVSREVMPEEVVVNSDLENDEHITRPLAAYNVDGVHSSGPREEVDGNQTHVEYEEDVGNSAGSATLEEADQNPPLVEHQQDIGIAASSGPLDEAGEDRPHVEHEENIGNAAGSETLEEAEEGNRLHVEHEETVGNTAGNEPHEEAEDNRLHVEHEENVRIVDGNENVQDTEARFVGKAKKLFRVDKWKKPRKEKID